jgi:mRNA-degrading endonuclease RelE of RelBE toxin-antitoxin system
MAYTVMFTQTVADIVTKLHPDIKKQLKLAVKQIVAEPYSGKELQEELAGFLSYRFKRHRILYQIDDIDKSIIVVMFGHRRDVYELLAELQRHRVMS